MWNSKSHLFLIGLGLSFAACSANAPSNSPCERKCGSRPVGGGSLAVAPANADSSISCSGTNAVPAQEFHFLVYEDNSAATSSGTTTSTTTTTTEKSAADKADGYIPKRRPKGGISVYPVVSGAGTLLTPSSDWCTDSCGVASFSVQPTCASQVMSIGLVVQGANGESTNATGNPVPPIKLTVTKE